MEVIQAAASELLVNVALGVITILGAYAVYYLQKGVSRIQAQTEQIRDEELRKTLDGALADVERLVTVTVGSIEQTAAQTLRDAVKLGTADREELVALGQKAFDSIKASVSPAAQEIITRQLGSFDSYLKNLIEDTVRKVKNESPYLTLGAELAAHGGIDATAIEGYGDAPTMAPGLTPGA